LSWRTAEHLVKNWKSSPGNHAKNLVVAIAAARWPPLSLRLRRRRNHRCRNFIHLVSNVEKSLEFYHNVLGWTSSRPLATGQESPAPRPYIATPEIVSLYNAAGAQYRVGATLVAGSPMRASSSNGRILTASCSPAVSGTRERRP